MPRMERDPLLACSGCAGAQVARRLPRVPAPATCPGLDGLRAISVTAVLLYHADLPWMPGGFLGVEVFFVISGYLITLLLTEEHSRSSTISLRNFWTPPGPPAAPCAVPAARRRLGDRAAVLPRGGRQPGGPGLVGAVLRHELVLHHLRAVVLRARRTAARLPAPVVAGDRGAVLPRLAARAAGPAQAVRQPPPRHGSS